LDYHQFFESHENASEKNLNFSKMTSNKTAFSQKQKWLAWSAIPAALILAEILTWWWLHPSQSDEHKLLSYQFPYRSENSKAIPVRDDIKKALSCDHAQTGWLNGENGISISVNYFEWNDTRSVGLNNAFEHKPEDCMGNTGRKVKAFLPDQIFSLDGQNLVFDGTQFEDEKGHPLYIFKLSWAEGSDGANLLREKEATRRFRFQSAAKRWFPRYARVLMVGVFGAKNPQQAWDAVRKDVLVDASFSK